MKTAVLAMMCMALVGGGVVLGFLVALSTLQPSASSVFPEYLAVSDVKYGVGSDGWIAFAVNNMGIASVTLVKVYVNSVKQTSVTPSFPISVGSDNGVVLNVTMSTVPEQNCLIDLFTSRGNKFSMLSTVPSGGQQAGLILYKSNVAFYNATGVKKIDIDIGNSGTSETRIIQAYIGTLPTALCNQTINPVTLWAGAIQRITFDYNWTTSTTYYFKVVSSSGQTLNWPEQAPVNP